MKPVQERLNDQLEHHRLRPGQRWQHLSSLFLPEGDYDLEVEHLVILAWSLRSAPQLRVTPHFARQMESQLLRSFAARVLRADYRERVALLKRWLIFVYRCRQRE